MLLQIGLLFGILFGAVAFAFAFVALSTYLLIPWLMTFIDNPFVGAMIIVIIYIFIIGGIGAVVMVIADRDGR